MSPTGGAVQKRESLPRIIILISDFAPCESTRKDLATEEEQLKADDLIASLREELTAFTPT